VTCQTAARPQQPSVDHVNMAFDDSISQISVSEVEHPQFPASPTNSSGVRHKLNHFDLITFQCPFYNAHISFAPNDRSHQSTSNWSAALLATRPTLAKRTSLWVNNREVLLLWHQHRGAARRAAKIVRTPSEWPYHRRTGSARSFGRTFC
jgi:hypothetical protein